MEEVENQLEEVHKFLVGYREDLIDENDESPKSVHLINILTVISHKLSHAICQFKDLRF